LQCAVYREMGTSDHAPVVAIFDLGDENRETMMRESV
jgi:hypothetical protein